MTPPKGTYSRKEVKKLLRGRLTLRERRDNKDTLVRLVDLDTGLHALLAAYPPEFEILVLCGLFQVPFRDAEVILGTDHVSVYEAWASGVAHLTDYLNDE